MDGSIAADYVGLDYAPPYLAPTTNGAQLLQGVNYASGAGGILDESGAQWLSHPDHFASPYIPLNIVLF